MIQTSPDIAPALLAYLRDRLGAPDLGYAGPPARVLGGYDTSIYAIRLSGGPAGFDGPLIVRVFRGVDASQAAFESAVQNAVAFLGFPVPRVLATCADSAVVGGPFIVMERVPGRIMLDELLSPRGLTMPGMLGRTHARLHALDVGEFRRQLEDAGIDTARRGPNIDLADAAHRIETASLAGLVAGMNWLRDHVPDASAPVICHGDFHPLNVLVYQRDVSGVIDWAGTQLADAEADVGAAVALFGQGPVDLPGLLFPIVGFIRRRLLGAYLRAYKKERGFNAAAVRYYEALRLLFFLLETGEYRVDIARGGNPARKSPFEGDRIVRSIITRFRQITGVTLSLPPRARGAEHLNA